MSSLRNSIAALSGAVLGAGLLSFTSAAPAAGASTDAGFLNGRVVTRGGTTYEGRIRWGDEEASWSDLFHSMKVDKPWLDEVPRRDRRRRGEKIEIFGFEIGRRSWHEDHGRMFVARFGDLAKIRVDGGDEATVWTRGGTEFRIEGGSNDVEEAISIWDPKVGEIQVPWKRIETIEFLAGPPAVSPSTVLPRRLYGTVETSSGSFTGTLQWDQDECLSSDKLDGESDESDVALEMGNLQEIEKLGRRASRVVLKDGSRMEVSGTNDVDDDNRGVYVDDARYGRVLVHWKAFDRVRFSDGPALTYADFAAGTPLRGKVTDQDGKTYSGRIVYDLDESESWELLNGHARDVEYSIPFAKIAAIIPVNDDESRVVLRSGEELRLEEEADVTEENQGILIFADGGSRPAYVSWDDLERIDFDK
jgi:hypothetical protein